jgi:sortase A
MSIGDAVAETTDSPFPPAGLRSRSAGAPRPILLAARPRMGRRTLIQVIGAWMLSAVVGVVIVLYLVSPLFQQRDQHRLLTAYRGVVHQSSLEATGLFGLTLPTQPPPIGSTVGIVEIGRLHLQEAVTEGVGPAQTERGPGHVPGTSGLGQTGNAVLVGRRAMFGAPFSGLSSLRTGDPIVVTTVEGQSLYVVTQSRSLTLVRSSPSSSSAQAPTVIGATATVDALYGSSPDNRLTLVTSRSDVPWGTSGATVVVATMKTEPFTPTLQESRLHGEDGRSAAAGAWAPFVLAVQAFVLAAWGAMVLYRHSPLRTAYLLSTAPLVVVTILLAVAAARLLPAWA